MPAVAAATLPAVDTYIAKTKPFAQPILEQLREAVHEAAPEIEEQMKWSRPFFVYRGIILGNMSAFKEHCSFGLWGSEIAAELRKRGVASGDAMGTFGRLTSLADLPPQKQLVAYIRLAAQKIDEGTRTRSLPARTRVAKPAMEVPEVLTAALKKDKVAAAKFAAMSPSCRREYCEWVVSAKRDETRDKRVTAAMGLIAEGRSRNWKYETR